MSADRSFEPIIGWRVWNLSIRAGSEPVLLPVGAPRGEWPARRAFEARCLIFERNLPGVLGFASHDSPDVDCSCGIYASSSASNLVSSTSVFPVVSVVGTVSMWGRMIVHERGWRAQFAYPARLTLVCGLCLHQGHGVGRPSIVVGGALRSPSDELLGLCAAHERAIGWFSSSRYEVAEMRGALLDRYAVDLMPFETVHPLFRRARSRHVSWRAPAGIAAPPTAPTGVAGSSAVLIPALADPLWRRVVQSVTSSGMSRLWLSLVLVMVVRVLTIWIAGTDTPP